VSGRRKATKKENERYRIGMYKTEGTKASFQEK